MSSPKQNHNINTDLLTRVMDVMPYGMVIANYKGEFIFHNIVARSFFTKELIPDGNSDGNSESRWGGDYGLYTVDKITKFTANNTPIQRALRGEFVVEEKFFLKTKTVPSGFYIKASSYPIRGKDGEIEAGIVVFEDISKQQIFYDSVISKFEELKEFLAEGIEHDKIESNGKKG